MVLPIVTLYSTEFSAKLMRDHSGCETGVYARCRNVFFGLMSFVSVRIGTHATEMAVDAACRAGATNSTSAHELVV